MQHIKGFSSASRNPATNSIENQSYFAIGFCVSGHCAPRGRARRASEPVNPILEVALDYPRRGWPFVQCYEPRDARLLKWKGKVVPVGRQ